MRTLGLLLVAGGVVLLVWGGREGIVSHKASAEPQEITCKRLGMKGPGDNAHVRLQEFLFLEGNYVFEEKKGDGGWSRVWIPTFPLGTTGGAPGTEPTSFRVIVRSEHLRDQTALDRLGREETLDGLVVNDIDSLGSKEKGLLQAQFPGVNLDRCWIVDHGRRPKPMLHVAGILVLGLALLGAGIRLFARARHRLLVRPKSHPSSIIG